MEGEIGKTAKQLVRSWKQLLAGVNEGRGRGGEEVRERGGEGKGRGKRGTGEEGRVGEETSSVVHPHSSPPSLLTPPTVSSNRQTTCELLLFLDNDVMITSSLNRSSGGAGEVPCQWFDSSCWTEEEER